MRKKFDIFISYRRDGGQGDAALFAIELKRLGYSVFFDHRSLKAGLFHDQLFNYIHKSKDFIIILPQNALDRCWDENDIFREELSIALKEKKNIIPILLEGFQFPEK